jgi:hypothetical protein
MWRDIDGKLITEERAKKYKGGPLMCWHCSFGPPCYGPMPKEGGGVTPLKIV